MNEGEIPIRQRLSDESDSEDIPIKGSETPILMSDWDHAARRSQFGSLRLTALLRALFGTVNHKRVARLNADEGTAE